MISKYRLIKLTQKNRSFLSKKIKNIEKDIYYPLGDDFFKIDHGTSYFDFFERLGEMHYWCLFDKRKKRLIATFCAILREINSKKVWYICDLKVIKEYRGLGISKLIIKRILFWNLFNYRIFAAYCVSMDSTNTKRLPYNKIKKISFGILKKIYKIHIYSLTKKEYFSNYEIFSNYYLTHTDGNKNLILKSNSKSIELLHLSKNKYPIVNEDHIDNNSVIMISCFANSKLDLKLTEIDIKNISYASVLSCFMKEPPNVYTDEI
ncbi:hypothetical protein fh0823_24120 [Francisella halioticida]|uniref:GNAT family N-acetyltransferase n=1 Tax=Francisella halioticida TaxID=549298 RepID=UPI001AF26789|nr:GNAT family N-acetyltransferase [Francisella halioticida]BCD92273.1 hypothetical protein fh0823_24120 [Francisella halioticida]